MRICVVGAGSIGGYLAVLAGTRRKRRYRNRAWAHLAAIRDSGLRLTMSDSKEHTVTSICAADGFVRSIN